VDPSDTTQQIKLKYHEKSGVDPEQQRLIYDGKGLEDDQTVANYNVQNEATVHVILKLRA
jgi:hypothetical protein